MEEESAVKQDRSKTTPSSHRDFFAKLYGSLEEEYNKKRSIEVKKCTNDLHETTDYEDRIVKHNTIQCDNALDEESEDEKESRTDIKDNDTCLSPEISPGSSPTKDEEISPPRVPPPTLKQLHYELNHLSIGNYVIVGNEDLKPEENLMHHVKAMKDDKENKVFISVLSDNINGYAHNY